MLPKRFPEAVAGIDLGSNSFHMIVARVSAGGEIQVIDRIREGVRLAAGIDASRNITAEAQRVALRCLERFGQRVKDFPLGTVRVAGTNTLRMAKNSAEFLLLAEKALGHPIEVIPGREEARLIYVGVAHTLAAADGRRLVVDIGGGSTECIIGEQFEPIETNSLYMGCVSYSQKYFPNGDLREDHFERAEIAARLELQTIEYKYRELGWTNAIGSSGTILSVDETLRANGWSDEGISAKGIKKLKKAMVAGRNMRDLSLNGLSDDRKPVFAGGVAILSAIFNSFALERLTPSSGALREGLLYDLLGRIRHGDIRDQTIRRLMADYHVDQGQAARVETLALELLQQAGAGLGLDVEAAKSFLIWASRLHEMGLDVSYTGYQKHSAYLVEHSDMPGFSKRDHQILAALILGHRRKLAKEYFATLPARDQKQTLAMCVLFRLAICLSHGRSPGPRVRFVLVVNGSRLELAFPEGWLAEHPLTREDLKEEGARLKEFDFDLSVS